MEEEKKKGDEAAKAVQRMLHVVAEMEKTRAALRTGK